MTKHVRITGSGITGKQPGTPLLRLRSPSPVVGNPPAVTVEERPAEQNDTKPRSRESIFVEERSRHSLTLQVTRESEKGEALADSLETTPR